MQSFGQKEKFIYASFLKRVFQRKERKKTFALLVRKWDDKNKMMRDNWSLYNFNDVNLKRLNEILYKKLLLLLKALN